MAVILKNCRAEEMLENNRRLSGGGLPERVCNKLMGKRSLSIHPHPSLPLKGRENSERSLKTGHKTHLTQGLLDKEQCQC
jgi:hypothetical protein